MKFKARIKAILYALLAVVFVTACVVSLYFYTAKQRKSLWRQLVMNVMEVTEQGGHSFEVYLNEKLEMVGRLEARLSNLNSDDRAEIESILASFLSENSIIFCAVFDEEKDILNFGVHFDKIDDTLESIFLTDGNFDGNGVGVEPLPHHAYGSVEVSAVDIHFIDVGNTGNLILVRLTPYGFGLRFDAALCAERCNRAVEYAQRALYFYGEVNVSRGVDDVYSALLALGLTASRPVAGGSGGSNCNSALLFLYHPVHGCGTVVRFADFVIYTGVVQNTFGSGGFSGVDVRHNTDVSRTQ